MIVIVSAIQNNRNRNIIFISKSISNMKRDASLQILPTHNKHSLGKKVLISSVSKELVLFLQAEQPNQKSAINRIRILPSKASIEPHRRRSYSSEIYRKIFSQSISKSRQKSSTTKTDLLNTENMLMKIGEIRKKYSNICNGKQNGLGSNKRLSINQPHPRANLMKKNSNKLKIDENHKYHPIRIQTCTPLIQSCPTASNSPLQNSSIILNYTFGGDQNFIDQNFMKY